MQPCSADLRISSSRLKFLDFAASFGPVPVGHQLGIFCNYLDSIHVVVLVVVEVVVVVVVVIVVRRRRSSSSSSISRSSESSSCNSSSLSSSSSSIVVVVVVVAEEVVVVAVVVIKTATSTNLVTEDVKRIIQFLLSNTTLNVKIRGANIKEPFLTNIGTPQGDSISPALFIIYLEQELKNVRSTLDSPSNTTEAHLPNKIVNADDIDFIGNQPVNVKIEETLKVHKLKVNVDKTEHTSVRKHSEEWKTSKKVGSLLGSKEDIRECRKHLSNIALNKMEQIWHRADKTKQRKRIKLYNTLVRSEGRCIARALASRFPFALCNAKFVTVRRDRSRATSRGSARRPKQR
ncbi:LOW QUALITY PROTEIN: hypothetical protein ElyMa_006432500 [Elysia marginata]|uniref:Reverse transcriptase domain-containing protein n=1 Tax=Elysia marginata TaxID=1093978 RepID=A0AAV4HWL7_9GAST|nr:LOW QUALITY PROTEIN: hypothetical protein ElyMa_006432500 [Elysia marginata]